MYSVCPSVEGGTLAIKLKEGNQRNIWHITNELWHIRAFILCKDWMFDDEQVAIQLYSGQGGLIAQKAHRAQKICFLNHLTPQH